MAALKSGSHACRLDWIRDMYAFFFFLFHFVSFCLGCFPCLVEICCLLQGLNAKEEKLSTLNQTKMLTSDAKPPLFTGRCLFLLVVVIVLLAFDNFNNDKASR